MGKTELAAVPGDSKSDKPDKWQIDSWTNTVVDAMEILNDPAKMKHIKAGLDKKKKALMSLDQVKKRVAEESE